MYVSVRICCLCVYVCPDCHWRGAHQRSVYSLLKR